MALVDSMKKLNLNKRDNFAAKTNPNWKKHTETHTRQSKMKNGEYDVVMNVTISYRNKQSRL